jgi:hypothetical protein
MTAKCNVVEWNEVTGDFYGGQGVNAVITRRNVKAADLPKLIGKRLSKRLIETQPHQKSGQQILRDISVSIVTRKCDLT